MKKILILLLLISPLSILAQNKEIIYMRSYLHFSAIPDGNGNLKSTEPVEDNSLIKMDRNLYTIYTPGIRPQEFHGLNYSEDSGCLKINSSDQDGIVCNFYLCPPSKEIKDYLIIVEYLDIIYYYIAKEEK